MGFVVLAFRATCRVRFHNDPRPALKEKKQTYIYCILHGQQMAAVFGREKNTGAMLSRSADGELMVPAFKMRSIVPFRGSSNKGGIKAFQQMVEHSNKGFPTYFAVDGPKGPRGYVKRGIADLALKTNSCILVTMALASRRWILHKAWDRFQIPKPFSRIDVIFTEPLYPKKNEDPQALRARINKLLLETERQHDPKEAKFSTEEKTK